MRWRLLAVNCTMLLLFCITLFPTTVYGQSNINASLHTASLDFPAVNPDYIYNQLYTMVTRYQRREAGYDTEASNGHAGFANYWAQEMVNDLQGFGPQIHKDTFPVQGWQGRAATSPAENVEVSIPGATHPEQVVVIGCHYDGEAVSTQSANDDASGCAIELGVAKAMGDYWRQHHTYPSRTLRFVIFDAEEQGLYGSFHYLNQTINGDTQNITAMFNEEQNGIAYPLRYLGQLSNPLLPFYIEMSPLKNIQLLYPNQENLPQQQKDHIARFRTLMQQAIEPVFAQFQAMGYSGLTYHGNNGQDIAQPIFSNTQISNIHAEDDTLGGSDQIPFTLAGIPCATFVGNSTYYDNKPPAWSYPFDQPQDTIQLMNTFADGNSQKSNALTLALALPGMLTTWMLNQPDILGQTAASALPGGDPLTSISDIGLLSAGQPFTVDAKATFTPNSPTTTYTYNWDFGDGTQASGDTISHTYSSNGDYTLTLTINAAGGQSSVVKKTLHVVSSPVQYHNLYSSDQQNGIPPPNPQVTLPTPNDQLSDQIIREPGAGTTSDNSQPQVSIGNTKFPLAL
ncbi:MAG TPA: M28 family peptidase, partial [Ktedonobacteraceae bacterium]